MAINFPLQPPSSPSFSSYVLRQINVIGQTISPFTLQRQTQIFDGKMWEIEATLPPMGRIDAAPWQAFFASLEGVRGTALMGDPMGGTPLGVGTGTPLVDGALQVGSSLATKGWTPSQTGILKAGDYLGLGTGAGSRLHMNLKDVNSDGGGLAVFDLWPTLRVSPADNDPITVNNTVGVFRLAINQIEWEEINPNFIAPMAFVMSEVL